MPTEIEGRIHGDGRLVIEESFFELTNEEYDLYLELLRVTVAKLNLDEHALIDEAKPEVLNSVVLLLKQKFEIGYSNGCPWPMKATIDRILSELSVHLANESKSAITLEEIGSLISESRNEDGRASFLFQLLVESANESLRQELLSYQPWERLEKQEDRNLPEHVVRLVDPQSYGLANDLPFFQVVKPLLSFIYYGNKNVIIRDRYPRVLGFFEETLGAVQNIRQLIEETEKFVDNQFTLIVTYDCNHGQTSHSFETFQTTVYSSILPCGTHPEQPAYASKARPRN